MIKSIKKSIIIVMAVVLLFVLASCAIAENNPKPKSTPVQTTDDTEYPLTITDTQGNKFKVEKEPEDNHNWAQSYGNCLCSGKRGQTYWQNGL